MVNLNKVLEYSKTFLGNPKKFYKKFKNNTVIFYLIPIFAIK